MLQTCPHHLSLFNTWYNCIDCGDAGILFLKIWLSHSTPQRFYAWQARVHDSIFLDSAVCTIAQAKKRTYCTEEKVKSTAMQNLTNMTLWKTVKRTWHLLCQYPQKETPHFEDIQIAHGIRSPKLLSKDNIWLSINSSTQKVRNMFYGLKLQTKQ